MTTKFKIGDKVRVKFVSGGLIYTIVRYIDNNMLIVNIMNGSVITHQLQANICDLIELSPLEKVLYG